ncbi:MAG TPA: DUF3617 family protein [Spongiibacteraceae bacterium]|jgi:hypothetical protein
MKNILSGAALAAVIATAPALGASLNLRTGAWEMTLTTVTTGNVIAPSTLEKLQPEQREQIERNMQERSGKPSIQIHKTCVSQKDIDEMNLIKADDKNCSRKIKAQSSMRVDLDESCGEPDANQKSISIETKNPESLLLIADVQSSNGGKIHLDVNGRWLASDCKGILTETE